MRVFRISKCRYISDLTGFGAFTYGGRWNSKGFRILYTAGSASLSLLEALAHMERPFPTDFCRVVLELPTDGVIQLSLGQLPLHWTDHPAPDVLKEIGNAFILSGQALALRVPSVIVPEEYNYLINVAHPRAGEIKIVEQSVQPIDERL